MKSQLRREMQRVLAALAAESIATASAAACRAALELPEYRVSRVVMLYLPMPIEADPRGVFRDAWSAGKTVLVPKVVWPERRMLAIRCDSLSSGLVSGRYDILEPAGGEAWDVAEIDFILTPALAYDRRGNRLGRGAGLYDRFLGLPEIRAFVCGFALDVQLIEQVPVTASDSPVNMLVTDRHVLRFG